MVGFVASAVFQFLLVLVVTRGLATPQAGAFLEAVALFMILSNFGELGADTAMVRMVPRFRAMGQGSELRHALLSACVPVMVVGVVAACATYALAGDLARVFFSEPQRAAAADYIRIFAWMLPVASLTTVVLAATRGFGSMTTYVGVQNLGIPLARLILVAAAIAGGATVTVIAIAWSVPLVVGLLIAAVACQVLLRHDRHNWRTQARELRSIAWEVWSFAAPRALAAVFGVTITWFDVLLVGALASTREAAIYAAISRLSVVGTYALQAMGMAVAPQFSELVTRRRRESVQHLYQVSTWWMMALTWPLYLVMIVYSSVVAQLFGSQYSDGAVALAILSAAGLFNLGTGNVTILLLMAGNSTLNMLNAGGSLAVNIGLNLLLIPSWGMTGAAVAWAASIVVNNTAALLEVRHLLRLRPFGPGYWAVAAASVSCFGILGLLLRAALGNTATAFVLTCVIGGLAYLLVIAKLWDHIEMGALVDSFRGTKRPDTVPHSPSG